MAKKLSQAEVEALFLSHSLKVLGKYVNSQTPLKSRCLKCNNVISPRLDKVTLRGHQCGFCSGKLGGEKRALAKLRELGHKPLEAYPGAVKPWKMQCGGCGKVITPQFNSLQQGKWGCGYCGHSRAGRKRREENSAQAIKVMRKALIEPLVEFPGSHQPWKSQCLKCSSIIRPRYSAIQAGQGGCRKCGIASSAQSRMLSEKEAIARLKKLKLKPIDPYPGSAKPWKCECLRCGSIVKPRLNYLSRSVFGCAVCAGNIVDEKVAIALMKKSKLIPQVKFPGSDKPWPCICKKCNREVSPRYSSIKQGQGGCKWCAKAGARVDPSIAAQTLLAVDIQPLEPFKTSHAKWKSRCLRCEKVISPSYHDIKQGSGGCKYCAPNFVNLDRVNEVMKKAGLEPQEQYPGSKAPWKVMHKKCGRIFSVQYANIRKSSSCRYCAGVAVIPAEAISLMKSLGMKPLTPYPGGRKPWKCKCLVCERIIFPTYSSSAGRNSGCIYCTGHKVDAKDAKKLMIESGLTPLEPFPGASKKWKCRCDSCLRVVTPMYTSIQGGQGGCKYCAEWGIDYGARGFLYLMTNKALGSHKLGIGNSIRTRGRNRITQHEKHGWFLYKSLEFETTEEAFVLEQKVLIWLRSTNGLGVYLSESEMPQGGYSETVDASEIDLTTIWKKVLEFSRAGK